MRISAMPRRPGRPAAKAGKALDRHVLDVASRLFIAQGYAGTSIEQIASEAQVSKLTIYRRYSSKEELFIGVVSGMSAALQDVATNAEKLAFDPLTALQRACRANLDFIARPDAIAIYRILLTEATRFPSLVTKTVADIVRPHENALLDLIRKVRQSGQLRKDCDDEQIMRALNGLLTGWAVKEVLLGFPGLADERERSRFFDHAWAIFLDGVRTK